MHFASSVLDLPNHKIKNSSSLRQDRFPNSKEIFLELSQVFSSFFSKVPYIFCFFIHQWLHSNFFFCLPHGFRREKILSVVASIIASKLYCSKFCQRSVTVIILFENNAILITFIPDKLYTSSTLSHLYDFKFQVLLHWSFLLIASESI